MSVLLVSFSHYSECSRGRSFPISKFSIAVDLNTPSVVLGLGVASCVVCRSWFFTDRTSSCCSGVHIVRFYMNRSSSLAQ